MTWLLRLNDMRAPQVEILTTICRAETREELEAFLARERVDDYADGQWGKSYRYGGPLEWFNPNWDEACIVDVGSQADWIAIATRRYLDHVFSVPEVPK